MSKYTIGDSVKIRLAGSGHMEKIWATVMAINHESKLLTVKLDNHPINPAFQFGEQLEVPERFVFEKWVAPSEEGK